jgi:glutamate-1-semialdehyde 2,1-aminomutase
MSMDLSPMLFRGEGRAISNVGLCETRAKRLIPGQSQLLSKRSDRFSQGVWPSYGHKAKGVEVWDVDGRHYIDMSIGGMGATVLGYADPDVDAAVIEAIGRGVASSLNCPEELELADLLCDLHPWAEMARFTRSGGEAMAVAVRIARAQTRRDLVAVCGYHGWHDWYLAANLGETSALDGHLLPGLEPRGVPSVLRGTTLPFKFNDIDDLVHLVNRPACNGKLAAIVLEPWKSVAPTHEFLDGVRTLATEAGAVLIVDEITAGFRVNTGGLHRTLGLTPDLAVFAKALGNGYAMGAVIGVGDVMRTAANCFISSTCWTERLGPVAACAMIRKHGEQQVPAHLMTIGAQVMEGWRLAFAKHGLKATVRGLGPIASFTFDDHQAAPVLVALFVQQLLDRGFLAGPTFYAMYAHQPYHIAAYLAALDMACKDLATMLRDGTPGSWLRGQPAVLGFGRLA